MISTRAEAVAELDKALAALSGAATAQSYSVGELSVQSASLRELRDHVAYWRRIVAQFDARDAGAVGVGSYAKFR